MHLVHGTHASMPRHWCRMHPCHVIGAAHLQKTVDNAGCEENEAVYPLLPSPGACNVLPDLHANNSEHARMLSACGEVRE